MSRVLHTASCALLLVLAATGVAEEQGSSSNITLETNEKPLDLVLQWISRRAGLNIVTNEAEQPLVTIRLIDVPWEEALDQIARRYDMVIEKRSERIWELTRPPRISMHFQNANLQVVLGALARQANVNIIISKEINAENERLTMSLDKVPWRNALDVIVKTAGFTYQTHDYNIVSIVTEGKVDKDMDTRVFELDYANGEEVKASLEAALSDSAEVAYDERTSSLVITDIPENLEEVSRLLQRLDRQTRQVQMEMKFVEFSTSDAQKIGFDGNLSFDMEHLGNMGLVFAPFAAAKNFTLGNNYAATNSPYTAGTTSAGFTFEAITTLNNTEIIQSPSLLTLNNREAEIIIGSERSFAEQTTTTENGQTTTTLQEASGSPAIDGIKITVTPKITSDGFVSMQLDATDETVTFQTFSVGGDSIDLPHKRKKQIKTEIMVGDGETAVLAGLLTKQVEEEERRVPVLGSIPLLGWLFRGKEDVVMKRNLSIFITPRIAQMGQADELAEARLRLRESLSGLDLRPKKDTAEEP